MATHAVPDTVRGPGGPAWTAAAVAAVVALVLGLLLIEMMPRLVTAGLAFQLGVAGSEAVIDIAIFAPMMAIATIAGRLQHVTVWRASDAPGAGAAAGLAVGVSGLITAALMVWLAGTIVRGSGGGRGALLLFGVLVTLVQVMGEEVYVRGWLQPVMARATGPVAGAAVAAGIFTLLHLAGGGRCFMSLLNITLAGFVFGLTALRTRGILAPIALHLGWNIAEQFLLGLDPNPGIGPFGALFDLDMAGSAFWGGSEEGLNASFAVTVVLLAICLPLMAWRGSGIEATPEPVAEAPRPAARHAWLVGEN